jgi:hypothetical protein
MDSHSLWTRNTLGQLAGLLVAPETNTVLAWDAAQRLILWDAKGTVIAEHPLRFLPTAVALSSDGHWIVVSDRIGRLYWFDDHLSLQFDYGTETMPQALAVEAFGQYVLMSNRQRHAKLLSRHGKLLAELETPRPLHYLAFLLPAPHWLGCADYGFCGCYDAQGESKWRDKPLANVGSFSTDGSTLAALACYTEGLLLYEPMGGVGTIVKLPGSCRQVSVAGNGKFLWTLREISGQAHLSLSLLRSDGTLLGDFAVPASTAFLAAGPVGTTCVYGTTEGQVVKLETKLPA